MADMTEERWLTRADVHRMLFSLDGKVSARKLRLFAAACCRGVWDLLTEEPCRQAVATLERFADGRAAAKDVAAIARLAWPRGAWGVSIFFRQAFSERPALAASFASSGARCFRAMATPPGQPVRREEHAPLLRDICGNPFRPVVAEPDWLAWNGGTVTQLAQVIYDGRSFDRLPVLADALEEAGCTEDAVLGHCRQPGEHVRGCWVVDLLLGKE
jgi:hypothetical protein